MRLLINTSIFTLLALLTGCGSSMESNSNSAGETSFTVQDDGSTGGEGNYGGAEVAAMAVSDDVTYLTQLGLMRGHLLVGVQLYRRGEHAAAETHMKHPEDELYAALVPALNARGATSLAEELLALSTAVEMREPVATVDQAYLELLAAIRAAEQVVVATPQQVAGVITELVRTAAEEYVIARAENGTVANVHEYQDSYGFVQVARDLEQQLLRRGANPEATARISAALDNIEDTWPDLIPPSRLRTEPAALYSAAALIEIAATRM